MKQMVSMVLINLNPVIDSHHCVPFMNSFNQDAGYMSVGAMAADTTPPNAMADVADSANTADANNPDNITDADLLEHLSSSEPIATTNLQQDHPVGHNHLHHRDTMSHSQRPSNQQTQHSLEPMD
jgi:hypothetical protein